MAACEVGECSTSGTEGYLLGIDIGTSTVKAVLARKVDHCVVQEKWKSLDSHLVVQIEDARERSVEEIFSCVEECVDGLSPSALGHVSSIGVCGQMTGCVLWKSTSVLFRKGHLHYEQKACSNFITWQDGRCTPDFLASLPPTHQPISISAGYGCATLAWMQRFQPQIVSELDRAGTIMDLLVSVLSGNTAKVVMSSQNAASWGYLDINRLAWEKDLLEGAGFPVRLLPEVVHTPSVAGFLQGNWYGIPEGTTVGIAMGDMQCSTFAAQPALTDAVLIIGSAGELVVIKPARKQEVSHVLPLQSVIEVPYFHGNNILAAVTLGGGNVIATFVSMLKEWLGKLGVQRSESELHGILISAAEDRMDTTLQVEPTLWGERHRPDARGSVQNIGIDNLTLGDISSATFRGIVTNLRRMMPREMFQELNIQRVLGSGSTLQRNSVLQQHTEKVFGLPLVIKKGIDAPLGAAMAVESLQQ